MRAAPLPSGVTSFDTLSRVRATALSLFNEQAEYHAIRAARCRAAAHWLGTRGEWFFLLTLALMVVKLGLILLTHLHTLPDVIALAGIALPAASAAFVGIRAYAEFELLEQQSARMVRVMDAARAELATIDLTRAVASQALGAFLERVAAAMLEDIQGWSLLVRTKILETG